MKSVKSYLVIFLLFGVLYTNSITCEENEIGVKFIKMSEGYNETWVVKSTNFVTLYESWVPEKGREEREVCLPITSNSQYIVDLSDNEWGWDSYLEIIGPYGNTIFKAVWYDYTYFFSLLMPILKGDTWKWSTELTPLWYESQIESWEDSISGEYEKTSDTHYFTIPFYGAEGMAAYEVKFYYRYGIVAYINGVEIYRDHMPTGVILPTTKSTAQYSTYGYYGTIRNGHEVSSPNNILAVEVHTSSSTAIRFDGWMAIYQLSDVSVSTLKCHPIQPIAARSNLGYDLSSIMDWSVDTAISLTGVSPGIDYFDYTIPTSQPNYINTLLASSFNYIRTMRFTHIDMVSGENTPLYDGSATLTESNEYKYIRMGNHLLPNVNKFRVYPMTLTGIPAFVIEQLPRVCNIPYSMVLTYPEYQDIYLFTVGDQVDISPKNWDRMTTCTSIPELPEGLTFNKCGIQGSPMVATGNITYTIMALDTFGTKVTSFQLGVMSNGSGGDDGPLSTMVVIIIVVAVVVVILVVVLLLLLKPKSKSNPNLNPKSNPNPGLYVEGSDPNPNPNLAGQQKPITIEMSSPSTASTSIPRLSTPSSQDPYHPSLGAYHGNATMMGTPGYDQLNTPSSMTPDTPGYSVASTPVSMTPDTPGYNRLSPVTTLGGTSVGGYQQETIYSHFQADNMSMMDSISQAPQYDTYDQTIIPSGYVQPGASQGLSLLHAPMGDFQQDGANVLMVNEDPLKAPIMEVNSVLAQSSSTSGLTSSYNSNNTLILDNSNTTGAPSASVGGGDNNVLILDNSSTSGVPSASVGGGDNNVLILDNSSTSGVPSASVGGDNSMLILNGNVPSGLGQSQPTVNSNQSDIIIF